jgi:succinyl-diaminopimelate desuccinylase
MINLKQPIEKISADLISIHSVIGSEKNLADEIEETLKNNLGNFSFTRINNSIICRIDAKKEKTIALVGHIDTVPLTRENQTTPEFKDGNLIGLGACDMKSGIASILKIFDEVNSGELELNHNLVVIFYEAEEGPLPNGINKLLDAKLLENIDFAYILEPTESKYSIGCLGALTVKKEIAGVSAHSANPKLGKNAIGEALKIYESVVEANKKLSITSQIDGLEYYETINITQMTTENAANVIPPKTFITINYRFSPQKSVEQAEKFVYDTIGGDDGVYFVDRSPSCFAGNAVNEFLLNGTEKEIMQAWTDIAQLNLAGIPAVNFGAGSIKVAHKPEEFININELQSFYQNLKKHL